MNLGIAMPFNAETTANIINDMTDCLHAVKGIKPKDNLLFFNDYREKAI